MGRMLETLKLGDARRPSALVLKPESATPAQDRVVEWEIGEEAPFVEVGAPNKKVELSPGLQQHPPQPTQPPHPPIEQALGSATPNAIELMETAPMGVAFEPWLEAPPATEAGMSAEIITFHQPKHPISVQYGQLLEQMLAATKTPSGCLLLLVGVRPNVGASTVLLNLAVAAALKQEQRVILIEANATQPELASRLGRVAYAGLPEVVDGTLALEQAIIKTALPTLHLLPGGVRNPLTAEAMGWLSAWLRTRYDLVFIDGPALDATPELAVQAPHVHGVYLVMPRADATATRGLAPTIARMGGRLCGVIHTQFE